MYEQLRAVALVGDLKVKRPVGLYASGAPCWPSDGRPGRSW